MGHQRLGKLPATRQWRQVVQKIADGAGAGEIASAVARAAEANLRLASEDPALRHGFWLLTQIPLAARQDDYPQSLRRLGLDIGKRPTLVEICTAMTGAVDAVVAAQGADTDDLTEMATLAAAESLGAIAGREGMGLFGVAHAPDEARAALRRLASDAQFGVLVRDFVARLTRRCLDYFLSRELANHVGIGRRFRYLVDHHEFDRALDLHCREVARVVQDFAAGWYSKAIYEGRIDPRKAGAFAHVAFVKLTRELSVRRGVHA